MNNAPWSQPMADIAIENIIVSARRRDDMGDLDGLMQSIRENGLLHPIVTDTTYHLVAGHRRLEACKRLGWEKVPIRSVGNVTPEQMRELELRENLDRKDFTQLELSKNMVRLVEAVRERMLDEDRFRAELAQNPLGGRPQKPDSLRAIARETGIPVKTIHDTTAHVAAVEQYPVLEELPKTTAIHIARQAKNIVPEQRAEYVAAMVTSAKDCAQDCKQIDREAAQATDMDDLLHSLGGRITEESIDIWLDYEEPDHEDVQYLIQLADECIAGLMLVKSKLKKYSPFKVIEGGKS